MYITFISKWVSKAKIKKYSTESTTFSVLILIFSDGGKPDFFQNPGSGSNPGFNLKNPGFPVPK